MALTLFWWSPDRKVPISNASEWESLDVILYNLAGKYRPGYEGDKMLVNFDNNNIRDTWDLLWRHKERGTLRVNTQIFVKPFEDER